jgi:starch synthase
LPKEKLKIAIVSSEVVPFAKTGGLADVAGALPKVLSKLGHEVKVFLPKYKMVDDQKFNLIDKKIESTKILIGEKQIELGLKSAKLTDSKAEFLFLVNDFYYLRDELYRDNSTGLDYIDNDERFILLARGALEVLKKLNWQPDIIHCNDWQSGLIPAYLKTLYKDDPFFKNTATLFSIHNLAYQGNFPSETFDKLGLDRSLFCPASPFEFWSKVSFLKAGIVYTDIVNTVSPTYALEIQSGPEYGYGLEGVLFSRKDDLFGIINGIDYDIWNPKTDELIPYKYDPDDLSGKEKNKEYLLKTSKLPLDKKRTLLIGVISRLADQKGFDLIAQISERLLSLDLKIVILGTGDEKYHLLFTNMQKKFPHKIKVTLGFDNKLAHLIEAGSDMFLMPSGYEPCGLNQLYSLKYGTVPIVRHTGGLADTIQDYNPITGKGNGFSFKDYNAEKLLETIQRAINLYKSENLWTKLMLAGMKQDFSWKASAKKYVELYQRALSKKW